MSHVAVLIQARMSSRRLPGKVTRPLAGQPAILRMMERVARVERADTRMVVTSTDPSDDELHALCQRRGLDCFRGSLDDVLARFLAACPPACDTVVRLTGDCPLVDPALVDEHIQRYLDAGSEVQYLSNAFERTFPDGLDVEVFSREILEAAARDAHEPGDREHVTPWIIRNAKRRALTQAVDLSRLRWTLDTAEDYANISALYDTLYPSKPDFDRFDVYRLLLARPELLRVADPAELTAEAVELFRNRLQLQLQEKT